MNYNNIPFEMRLFRQWVLWKYETVGDKTTKVAYSVHGFKSSVNKPDTWASYDEVLAKVADYSGIGFVLTQNDPYCFIDLDHTEDPKEFSKQQSIYNNFIDTYSELSPSGKGLHIITKARLPQGRRRGCVELYSSQRFMTMTGNVYNKRPIVSCQPRIDTLFHSFGQLKPVTTITNSVEQIYSDDHICETAYNANNGSKFYDLYSGDWQKHYSSQSEADHALINILSYYCRNKEQIVRIFRKSALGARNKALRDDYIGKMVDRSFDNYIPPVDIEALAFNVRKETSKLSNEGNLNLRLPDIDFLFSKDIEPIQAPIPDLSNVNISYKECAINTDFEAIPDGYIKEIARFIYAQSPRPIKTISTITAIGLMAGICGRAYNVMGTGLNNYFVLLGQTGIGKEAMSKGVNKLISSISQQQPLAQSFLGIGELVSGVSLLRYLSEKSQSCLTIQGEFGMTMQRMTGKTASTNMLQMRKILLDLYGKSGNGEKMRSTVYADTTRNIDEIKSPSFTLLAESTPSTFFDALNDGLVEEGLMSRFNILECTAKRPPLNKGHNEVSVPNDLQKFLLNLTSNCLTLNTADKVIDIGISPKADELLSEFDVYCDAQINDTPDESYRQLWNRGHLKSIKLAGLFAIADNIYKPVIEEKHAKYAISFVKESIGFMYKKYLNFEIGAESVSDTAKLQDMTYIIGRILLNFKNEKFHNDLMKNDVILSYKQMCNKCLSRKSFKNTTSTRGATTFELRQTLQNLVDEGLLTEIKPHILSAKYNYTGRAWAICNPSYFIEFAKDNMKNSRFNNNLNI